MLTKEQVRTLPDGTILSIPSIRENVILGEEGFDEFEEYEGRWITGVSFNEAIGGICYIISYDELMTGSIVKY